MSRCILKAKNPLQSLILGIDPPTGTWFVQLYDEEEEAKHNSNLGYILDKDFATKSFVLEAIAEYADLKENYNKLVLTHVALDLDPGHIPRN